MRIIISNMLIALRHVVNYIQSYWVDDSGNGIIDESGNKIIFEERH